MLNENSVDFNNFYELEELFMSRDLTKQVNAKVHPLVDGRLEGVCKKFGLEKAEIVRRCLDEALPKFERSRRLPALVVTEDDEAE